MVILQDALTRSHRDHCTDPLRGIPFEAVARTQGDCKGICSPHRCPSIRERCLALSFFFFWTQLWFLLSLIPQTTSLVSQRTLVQSRPPLTWFRAPFFGLHSRFPRWYSPCSNDTFLFHLPLACDAKNFTRSLVFCHLYILLWRPGHVIVFETLWNREAVRHRR